MFAHGDLVQVRRGGVVVATLSCGWDPAENKLYGPYGADVQRGDALIFRGMARRVIDAPEPWRNPFTGWEAGTVLTVEAAPPHLCDLGELARANGTVRHRELNTEVPVWETLWAGPCLVDPPTTDGSEAEAGQQLLTIQPFTVSVPLEVVDVRPEDRFTVTASADPRMVGRPLMVTRVKGASMAQVRQFTTIDNQG